MSNSTMPQQNWLELATIQIAGAICLPIIMIGEQIGRIYGLKASLIAIALGNIFLCIIAVITVLMSYRYKEYTIQNAMRYFGAHGTKILGYNMLISLIGWFAIQLNVISLSIEKSIFLLFGLEVPIIALNIIIGTAITIASLYGLKSISKLASISLPLFLSTMALALYQASKVPAIAHDAVINSYQGISLVIACGIMGVIDLPTYYRFARSNRDSVISITLLFLLAIPILEIMGVYIALHNTGSNILETLTAHQNIFWQLWILTFLILAGWTTNNMNLYSATTALDYIKPNLSYTKQTLLLGFLGVGLSCFNVLSNLEQILNGIGILISSMGGVIITNYLLKNIIFINNSNSFFRKNIISWVLGSAIGFASFFGLMSLTQFEIIDAYLVSSLLTCMIQLFCKE